MDLCVYCMCAIVVENGGQVAHQIPGRQLLPRKYCSYFESLFGLMCAFSIINAVEVYLRMQRASLLVCSPTTNNYRWSIGRPVGPTLARFIHT